MIIQNLFSYNVIEQNIYKNNIMYRLSKMITSQQVILIELLLDHRFVCELACSFQTSLLLNIVIHISKLKHFSE